MRVRRCLYSFGLGGTFMSLSMFHSGVYEAFVFYYFLAVLKATPVSIGKLLVCYYNVGNKYTQKKKK